MSRSGHTRRGQVRVVAGVDHGGERALAGHLGQPVEQLGAAGTPRQGQDHGRSVGVRALTAAGPSLPN